MWLNKHASFNTVFYVVKEACVDGLWFDRLTIKQFDKLTIEQLNMPGVEGLLIFLFIPDKMWLNKHASFSTPNLGC